jgi:hypothetical protein
MGNREFAAPRQLPVINFREQDAACDIQHWGYSVLPLWYRDLHAIQRAHSMPCALKEHVPGIHRDSSRYE